MYGNMNYPENELPPNIILPENTILSELINQHQIVPPIVEPIFAAPPNPQYFNYPPPPEPSSVMYNVTYFDPQIMEQSREVSRSSERFSTFFQRPIFSGSYSENVEDYLLSLEIFLSTNNIPTGLVVDMIASTLIGNAKRWFRRVRFSIRDFQSFVRIFRLQFNSTVEEKSIHEPPKPPVNVEDQRVKGCINVKEWVERLALALYKFIEIQNGLRNPAELTKIAEDFNNGTLEYDTPTFLENPSARMPASLGVAQSESPTEQMTSPQAQSSPMEPKSKSNPNRRKQNKNYENNLQQQPQQHLQQQWQQQQQQYPQQQRQQHPQQQQHHDQNQSQKPKKHKQRK